MLGTDGETLETLCKTSRYGVSGTPESPGTLKVWCDYCRPEATSKMRVIWNDYLVISRPLAH